MLLEVAVGGRRQGLLVPPSEHVGGTGAAAGKVGAGKGGEARAGGVAGSDFLGRDPQPPGLANLPPAQLGPLASSLSRAFQGLLGEWKLGPDGDPLEAAEMRWRDKGTRK